MRTPKLDVSLHSFQVRYSFGVIPHMKTFPHISYIVTWASGYRPIYVSPSSTPAEHPSMPRGYTASPARVALVDLLGIIIIIIIINVLIKVTLNEIRCRGTLQSQWSTLTDSTSLKAEESVNVTDESRSSWYSSWNGTGGSSDDGGRWRQTRRSEYI